MALSASCLHMPSLEPAVVGLALLTWPVRPLGRLFVPEDHCLPPHQLCTTLMMSTGSLMAAPLTTEDRTPGLSGHRAARHPPSPRPTPGPPGPQAQALGDSPAFLLARSPPSARSSGALTVWGRDSPAPSRAGAARGF